MADSYQEMVDQLFAIQAGQAPLPTVPAASVTSSSGTSASYNPLASPIYTGAQANATLGYSNMLANTSASEDAAAKQLGASLTRNPWATDAKGDLLSGGEITGSPLDWSTVDATNPFSRAALLKKSYNDSLAGTKNSLAARGQLRSGAFQTINGNQNFQYRQGQSSIADALAEIIRQSDENRRNAAGDAQTTTYNGLVGALSNVPQLG